MRIKCFILAMLLPALVAADDFGNLLRMTLDPLGGGERAAPADFLDGESLLCLVLWNSHCPECLANVAQLGEEDPPANVRLLGVNFDDVPWDAEDFLAARRPNFPQLHDPEARLALALGADGFSYNFAILSATGEILAIHYDSVVDANEILRQVVDAIRASSLTWKLKAGEAGETGRISIEIEEAPVPEAILVATSRRYPVINGSGRVRTRALSVSVWGDEPGGDCECAVAGPHGESLVIQKNLLYRLNYELVAELAPGVRAGGKLRIDNEDPALLEQGPEYLGSSFGSAFAEIHRGRLNARMGYFTEQFSPLTLQRWDFADNPPAAGSGGAGCGVCGAALRGVSLEALDDLGPEITFEGLHLEAALLPGLRATGFYAIPQRAVPSSGTTFDNPFAYRRDVMGFRLRYAFGVFGRGGGALSFHHLSAHEDGESSALPPAWSHLPISFIHKNEILSAGLELPLPGGFEIKGEAARSFERVDSLISLGRGILDEAYLLELSRKAKSGWGVSLAWQKLGPEFSSPFRALSYQSNMEGPRFSVQWQGRRGSLACFFKNLERIDDSAGADVPDKSQVISGLIGWKPRTDLALDLVGVLVRDEYYSEEDCRCDRRTLTLTARQQFGRRAELQADVSFLGADVENAEGAPRALIATLQFTADF